MLKNSKPIFLLLIISILMVSGCSVQMAAKIKDPYQNSALAYGRDRTFVISQIGQPIKTMTRNDVIFDTYRIKRNSKGWGYFRAGLYSFLDVGTFGLWELIGTPLERFIQTDEEVTIEYDRNQKVRQIHYLQI